MIQPNHKLSYNLCVVWEEKLNCIIFFFSKEINEPIGSQGNKTNVPYYVIYFCVTKIPSSHKEWKRKKKGKL